MINMKKISIQRLVVLPLALGLFFTSCKRYSSDFGDTNVNPGVTGSPILAALLTNVEAGLAGYGTNTRAALYCQYMSETQYTDVSLYSLPQINFEGEYSGSLYDLQNIINTNTSNNMTQLARILKAYIYAQITDRWGDVPYSQALQGNSTPVFDKQADIYPALIQELTQAAAAFNTSSAITGDILYGGSTTKWKKFANSLRMRLALQLTKKFPAAGGYAAQQFAAALNDAGGYIADNSDNLVVNFPGGNFKSSWFNLYDGRKDFGESNTMTALMSSLGDGRQNAYGGLTEDQNVSNSNWNATSSLGVPYGRLRTFVDPWTQNNPGWARVLRGDYRTEKGSVVLLSAAEVFLARAEAADRGWTSENMTSLYQAGINASFAQWGLAAPAASYFTQSSVALSAPAGTAANIQKLAIQQYVAGYPDGQRGWNIWRRTGFPALTPAIDATNSSKQIPRRYTYGQTSYGSNTAAVTAAAGLLPGGDTQDSKIWWDQ
jgi:hypothetical protein